MLFMHVFRFIDVPGVDDSAARGAQLAFQVLQQPSLGDIAVALVFLY